MAAYQKLEEIREETAVNIRRLIEDHKYVDICIHVLPTYVLVPDYGIARWLVLAPPSMYCLVVLACKWGGCLTVRRVAWSSSTWVPSTSSVRSRTAQLSVPSDVTRSCVIVT